MRLPHCAIGISFSMSFAMSCRRRASSLKSQATQASISYASIDRSVLALDGAELTIEAGESLAIVGESGSGRSTLGMAIGRLLPPEARRLNGDLIYEGRSVFTASDEEVRSLRRDKLGFIFQSPMAALDPTMRVGRQVALAIGGHPEMADIAALLERAELSDPDRIMRSFPHQLSGGMAQHVVIAMAIARGQRLLIAAEPSRLLKKSLRARREVVRREIFGRQRRHSTECGFALGHFPLAFTAPGTLRAWAREVWAGERDCRRRRRRRRRRGLWRGLALSPARARRLFCSSRSFPRCACAAVG
jgi:ABC-type lipoprotein export system ATPase subunit